MFLRGGKNRVGAAVALAAVLAMALATPAGAAPWGWGEARELTSGFLPRVLVWLGLSPIPSAVLKCDGGSQIDPNGGCPKASVVSAKCDDGSQIDPNGCPKASSALPTRAGGGRADDVDPVHRR